MRRLCIGLLLAGLLVTLPTEIASAATHPSLTLAKGRQLIQRYSQRAAGVNGASYATVSRCGRLAAWKLECVSTLTSTGRSRCVMIVTVWNTAVVGGYYSRKYSYRGLSCIATTPVAPTAPATPAAPTVPVVPPPPAAPTSIPAALVRSVADAYVGGIMRNAYSTFGGVDYCNYPFGFSGTCTYSFSGNRVADGSYYQCTGSLTIDGSYNAITGWQTTVDYGIGPQCF